MNITESAQMYLETILILSQKGDVRAIDIARKMNFSRPSVSITVHNLEKSDYIEISNNGLISLKSKGLEIAKEIYERHTIISEILQKIGVPKAVANEDACKIEHDINQQTFDCLKKHFGY